VRKEKKDFKKNINNKNKSDKKDFIKIIEIFLSNNFYYLSQKYIIYKVIVDVFEKISERVESLINDLIRSLLDEKNPYDLLKEIYFKKSENLKERIDNFLKNNKIYEKNIIKNTHVNVASNSRITSSDFNSTLGLAAPIP